MKLHAEVIAIGNEVLNGFVINSNAACIGQRLLEAGVKVLFHQTVPDTEKEIMDAMELALSRSSIVICTGGLGPTLDDCTRAAAAKLFQSPFHLDEKVASDLRSRYKGRPISLENQATVPTKATVFINKIGTAPGLLFERDRRLLFLLPGIPLEMEPMLIHQVIPEIVSRFPQRTFDKRRVFHLYRQSESQIDPTLRLLKERYPAVSLGIYPRQGSVTVHLYKDSPAPDAEHQLERASQSFKQFFESYIFSSETFATPASALQQRFIEKGWSLAAAESCTGGSIATEICAQAGASSYFLGGIIAYSNEAKENLLKVDAATIAAYGAVSRETAEAMARGALKAFNSDFAIATTGIAGPSGGSPEKPVGTVWIAVAGKNKNAHSVLLNLKGNRAANVRRTGTLAFAELWDYIK